MPVPRRGEIGKRAELAALDYLTSQGFELVLTNVRVGPLELDVVARKGGLVVFAEVRTRGRGSFEGALASVTPAKRRRIVAAAAHVWRERFAGDATAERMRFDVIAVRFEGDATRIEHVPGAFTA